MSVTYILHFMTRGTFLTAEDRAKIDSLHQEKKSVFQMSRTIKRHRDAISRCLNNSSAYGKPKKSRRNTNISAADRRLIIRVVTRG